MRSRGTSSAGAALGLTFLFATQLIPGIMLLVPDLTCWPCNLDLVDTYQGLVVAYAVTAVPFSIWILKGYYDTVPVDLEEAALIDGCSQFEAFRRVLLPLSLPALAIVFLFNFLAAWGEYFTAPLHHRHRGVAADLAAGHRSASRRSSRRNGRTCRRRRSSSRVPIVILFVYVSKYLVSGLTLGGVKG